MKALTKTDFKFEGQQSVYHGKVRDVYDINYDLMVMVATDRISAFDVIGVIIHLRLVGGELLFAVGGNTSIPSHLSSALGIERHFGMERL